MRDAIGLADKSIDILKFIDALSPENQTIAKKKIADVEEKAMKEMVCSNLSEQESCLTKTPGTTTRIN